MKRFQIRGVSNKRPQIMIIISINKTTITEWEVYLSNINNKNNNECMKNKNINMNLLKEKKYLKEENPREDPHQDQVSQVK